MLVFGALSFQVLPDDTVEIATTARQFLSHADVQELLSWLNYYSQSAFRHRNDTRLGYPPPQVPVGGIYADVEAVPQWHNDAVQAAPG